MTQMKKSAQFDPRVRWRRLPIRVKLLLPTLIALIIALPILLARVAPPINSLVENNVRGTISTQLTTLGNSVRGSLTDAQADLVRLANNSDMQDFADIQDNALPQAVDAQKVILALSFIDTITTGRASLLSVRYDAANGTPIINIAAQPAAAGSTTRAAGLVANVEGDAKQPYFKNLTSLRDGGGYALPPVLGDTLIVGTEQPFAVIEIGVPVYHLGQLSGVLIGTLRADDLLNSSMTEGKNTGLQLLLIDQNGQTIANYDPSTSVQVSLLPNIAPPPAILDGLDHDLTQINGRLYSSESLNTGTTSIIIPWTAIVSSDATVAFASAHDLTVTLIVSLTILLLIVIGGVGYISQSLVRPLVEVSAAAQAIAAGNFDTKISVNSEDEVGQVATAINAMSERLSTLVGTLETRVAERTRNLEISSEISRDVAQLSDLSTLLQHTVESIKDRFNFYHAQVFLVDDARQFAVLVTSTGEAGKLLLERHHRLAIGSDSVVGQTVSQNRTFITLDTKKTDMTHRFNPLLPETRSELALPLRIGDIVIGVLDIQSVEADAYGTEDVALFQTLADQIATAINKARLLDESERRVEQIADLNRQLTRTAWNDFLQTERQQDLSFSYDLSQVTPTDSQQPDHADSPSGTSVDIVVRGEKVGSLSVDNIPDTVFSEADRAVLRAVADRVALAVENARLIEQAQQAVARIDRLYQASRTLGTAVDLDAVYQVAADFLSTFEAVDRLVIMMAAPSPVPNPPFLKYVYLWERTPHPANTFQLQSVLPAEVFAFDRLLPDPHAPNIPDIEKELKDFPLALKAFTSMGIKTVLHLPLFTASAWYGVLLVESEQTSAFNQNFVQFGSAVSDQIAVAIDSRRLFETVQVEARRNRALAEAAQASSQIGMAFDDGVANLFRVVAEPANFDRWWYGQLTTIDGTLVLQRITSHFSEGSPLHILARIPVNTEQNSLTEAVRRGQAIVINDPIEDATMKSLPAEKARAFGKHAAIPINVGNTLVGAMMVGRELTDVDIDDRDVQLAVTVGNQIAVLSENQRLFNSAERGRETLQAVLDALPTGVIVVDAHTRQMTLTNLLADDLLGLTEPEPYIRLHTETEQPYEDEDFPPFHVLRTMEPLYADDMTVVRPSGEKIDLIVNAAPIKDADGNVISAVAVFQDVSDLRELENVLQDSLRETTSLYEISRAIAAENDLASILSVVAAQVSSVLPASHHIFAIFRDEAGNPSQAFSTSSDEGWLASEVETGIPVPLWLLEQNDVYVVSDIQSVPALATDSQLAALNISAIGVFPLNARARTAGWLVVGMDEAKDFTAEERRFLITLTDQAAIATENARLAQSTAQALSETTLLYEASFIINRAASIENALEVVRNQVKSFAPSQIDIFLVAATQETTRVERAVHWDGTDPDNNEMYVNSGISLDDIRIIDAPAVFIDNVAYASADDLEFMHRHPDAEGWTALASIPLTVAGRSTGRLVVAFNRTYHFGRLERQFLTALADQSATVINNITLVQQTQDSLEETGTLYQSSRAITDSPDLSQVLDAIIDHAAPPIVSWAALLRVTSPSWEADDAGVEVAANWDRSGDFNITGLRFVPDEFPAWEVAATTELLWVEDIATDPRLNDAARGFFDTVQLRSVVSVPLSMGGRAVGNLMLGSSESWRRTEREVRIFTSLADQAAITMENRSLLSQAERRARQLQTNAEVAQAATSILDLDELLTRTVNLIKDSYRYDHVQIFLVTPDKKDARLAASTGDAGRQLLEIKHHLLVGSVSIIGQVTALGRSQIAADTADMHAVHRPNPYLPNTRSELALPLIAKGVVLGALDVQSNRPGTFSSEDETLLANLADQIAVAIENARLFQISEQRVEQMQFLFDVTRGAMSGVEELDAALHSTVKLIGEKLQTWTTAILLPDESGTKMRPFAVANPDFVGELPAFAPATLPFFQRMMATKQPAIIADMQNAPIQMQEALVGAGSAMFLPLLAGENFIGVLGVTRREVNGFDNESLRVFLTLGSTLAAIIQNAQLLQQVQTANVRLREVDKLKSQFLANMSHELRTPLNSIIGFSRVILKGIDGPLSEMQEQDLTTIHDSGKHLLNLVNDILDQAKIEAGKMELSYSYFSLADLVKSVMSTASGLVKDKPVRLHQEIEGNLANVWGDEFRSRQVLLNLVSNAAKFTAQGSVTVSAFRVQDSGADMLQVSVTDTGIGIPEDKLETVFEAFQQAESTTARQYEGTGLGLPIARSLIEMQGGRIWVNSEIGIGSTFSFTLPMEPVKKDEPEPTAEPAASQDSEALENQVAAAIEQAETPQPSHRIILAVDDELSAVNLYRRYLVRGGYEVIGAIPEEAEELAITYQPRVILLDINMPNRSGWDVLQHLKDRDETFEIPVIVCSAESSQEKAFRLGAADYLVKPIEEATLVQRVKRVELERDRRKVLLIDDQPESIRLFRDAISADERFTILEAVGGPQGIDMVHSHWPDLIVLDLRMPDMDGFTVLQELRSNPDTATIPVLVVTADDLTDDERQRLNGTPVYQKQTVNAEDLLNSVVSQLTW